MRPILIVVIIVIICIVLFGCSKRKAPPVETGSKLEVIVDRDFAATIRKTKEPYVFEISLRQVSKEAGKAISGFPAIVDLDLRDGSGKVFAAKDWEKPQYAKEIGNVFSTTRLAASAEPLTGRFRLVRDNLPPGKYTVQPHVRIPQISTITDYPAGNSVEITIK